MVNADVTWRPLVRSDLSATASRSSSAATKALDSMYRTPALSTSRGDAPVLRFATIRVNQSCGRPWRKLNLRPALCRVTRLDRRPNYAGCNELVKAAWTAVPRLRGGRNKFRHHSAMCRDRDTFPRLDASYDATQVISELTYTRGRHEQSIAICGHIDKQGHAPAN